MLDHLDRQDEDFHIYVVLNSSNNKFSMGLVAYCAMMKKNVTLINLWSMTTQIGLAYNCGLWHALWDGRHKYIAKIDDDVALLPTVVSELRRMCEDSDDNCVAVALPWSRGGHYNWPSMLAKRVKDKRFIYGACCMIPTKIIRRVGVFTEEAQRGMDLDYAVRVQRAGYEVRNHPILRALHLGTMNGTEVDADGKKGRKYCDFGAQQVCTTIWESAEVRQALIAQVFGAKQPTQVESPQLVVD